MINKKLNVLDRVLNQTLAEDIVVDGLKKVEKGTVITKEVLEVLKPIFENGYNVKEVKINGAVFVLGSTVINKTEDDVKKVLLKTYPDAMNIVITTDHDMNNTYYEANFVTKKFKGEAKFNPATGVIIQRTLAYY